MSNAEQAFAMTAVLFGLSFAAIFFLDLAEGGNFRVSSRLAE